MKKTLLIFSLSLLTVLGYGQSSLWSKTSKERIGALEKFDRTTHPEQFQLFHLNLNQLKTQLANVPLDTSGEISAVNVMFPDYTGKLSNYQIYEAPVMEKGLTDKFPDIRSYVGKGITDKSSTVRFSITSFGFHLMMTSGNAGTYYIDTYTKNLENYIIYSRKDIQKTRSFSCFVEDDATSDFEEDKSTSQRVNDGNLRQYRLAISNTIEYAAYHLTAAGTPTGASLAVKKSVVLSAMVVSLTRLNGIYERDMAIRMNLIANNDQVIFIDTDNYTNSPDMINEIQAEVDGIIGSGSYDIGHGYCTTDSGIAQVSSVCGSGKARGITGNPAPVGDPFDVDYVAHEMGHQFGASHTQNNACNRSSASAFEPGSASTILGYAGICAPNVQSNSDAHFHARSILQMTSFLTSGATCRTITSTGNTAPVVNAGANYTIPNGTAFILKGSATDANGDALTYCWEQYNNEVTTQPPLQTATSGPNFRSFPPSTSPNRYMPRFSDVLSGNLAPTWEVVPTVARTMNFALTVRDNRAGGGMTNRGDMTVTTAAVGPFAVTSPSSNASWNTNSSQTITWNVAGTTANGINTSLVNILLSTDGGANFTPLATNVPNNGSYATTMPTTPAPNCRIMIEAVGNIFYAVSPNFSIGYTITTTCSTPYTNTSDLAIPDGPASGGYGGLVTNNIVIPVSEGVTISQVKIGLKVVHTYPQDLQISINHPNATQVMVWNRACAGNNNFDITLIDGSPNFTCTTNMTGTFSPSSPLNAFNNSQSNGTWSLTARDGASVDTGYIDSWSIEVCTQTATLITENFGLENFSIYPNPNNGNFTVQFDSTSGNDVKIGVHDIRGRLVFDKSYQNTGVFNQNIQLNSVESGVYMVTVQDGERKEVKKIVIK